ncbi:MAG: hypothetical protein MUC34_09140 [Anaerolineae bacterium]|jgi:hypothetical protein|nr:hypothetical protein [Anaerolineae bacterium]
MDLSTILGSAGVALLLLAFLLNLTKRLSQASILYSAMNMVGAGLSGFASYLIGFVPFVVLEGTWCLVAAVALLRALTGRETRKTRRPT